MTIGALESLDDELISRVQPDGVLKKPFEASVLLETVKPLAAAAAAEKGDVKPALTSAARSGGPQAASENRPIVAVIDAEQVRAAVTIALDAAMPALIDEIAEKVLVALRTKIS